MKKPNGNSISLFAIHNSPQVLNDEPPIRRNLVQVNVIEGNHPNHHWNSVILWVHVGFISQLPTDDYTWKNYLFIVNIWWQMIIIIPVVRLYSNQDIWIFHLQPLTVSSSYLWTHSRRVRVDLHKSAAPGTWGRQCSKKYLNCLSVKRGVRHLKRCAVRALTGAAEFSRLRLIFVLILLPRHGMI